MRDRKELIPPPPVIRDRLARNIRERRLLRGLLRLSIQAAGENPKPPTQEPRSVRQPEGGGQ